MAEARSRTEKWLEGVYKSELGRDLGDEGRKYWADDIHDRGQTQEQVIDNIRRSDEYKAYQRELDNKAETLVVAEDGKLHLQASMVRILA